MMTEIAVFIGTDLLLFLWPFTMLCIEDSKMKYRVKKRMMSIILWLSVITPLIMIILELIFIMKKGIGSDNLLNSCCSGMAILTLIITGVTLNMIKNRIQSFIQKGNDETQECVK